MLIFYVRSVKDCVILHSSGCNQIVIWPNFRNRNIRGLLAWVIFSLRLGTFLRLISAGEVCTVSSTLCSDGTECATDTDGRDKCLPIGEIKSS